MSRVVDATRPARDVVDEIILAFEAAGSAQVPGYYLFKFVRSTQATIVVLREKGTETPVRRESIERAVELVREDHSLYVGGPGLLGKRGITHINSPTWALIRLLSLNDIIR